MANAPLQWKGDAQGIYEISYKKQGDNFWITPDSSPVKGLSLTISGLDENTTYIFRIREYCPAGPVSKWLYYTYHTPAAECIAPVGLTTTNITETTADVSWTAATSAIGGYYVEYKIDGVNSWLTSAIISGTTHYTLTGLTAGSGYQWRVKSICANGGQATSAAVHFNTLTVHLQCDAIQAGTVTISADAGIYSATYTNSGGNPSTHLLEYSTDNGASWGQILNIFNQTTLSVTYALPSSAGIFPLSHRLRVTPKCADGSLGIAAIGIYTVTDQFTQYVTFQNALDAGSISGLRIDNNPNILTNPINVGGSRNWNQANLLGSAHNINGYFTGVNSGVTVKTSHIRNNATLWSGTSIYNGTNAVLVSNRVLADRDIIKVERQTVVNISGTIRLGINDYADHCHSQGSGFFKIALNQSFAQPIVVQIAYVTTVPATGLKYGVGSDIVPLDDPYKAYMNNDYYAAQFTIPANKAVYNNSSSDTYSSDSLVFLRKSGPINLFPDRDLTSEHGELLNMYPDCNPSWGSMLVRIYYKILSPLNQVSLNLVAVNDDVKASRITLVKL